MRGTRTAWVAALAAATAGSLFAASSAPVLGRVLCARDLRATIVEDGAARDVTLEPGAALRQGMILQAGAHGAALEVAPPRQPAGIGRTLVHLAPRSWARLRTGHHDARADWSLWIHLRKGHVVAHAPRRRGRAGRQARVGVSTTWGTADLTGQGLLSVRVVEGSTPRRPRFVAAALHGPVRTWGAYEVADVARRIPVGHQQPVGAGPEDPGGSGPLDLEARRALLAPFRDLACTAAPLPDPARPWPERDPRTRGRDGAPGRTDGGSEAGSAEPSWLTGP